MERISFAKIPEVLDIPDLAEIQKKSYEEFLQPGKSFSSRKPQGLEAILEETFSIDGVQGLISLEYVGYKLGEPRYNLEECRDKGLTYAAPLQALFRLIIKEKGSKGDKVIREVKEEEVYLGEVPLMTQQGTFMINGAQRVVVSQLHRSPGVAYTYSIHPNGKHLYSCRIIPYRGVWLEFELDVNDLVYVRIDRKRKLLATTLLRALGYPKNEEILSLFYPTREMKVEKSPKTLKVKEPGFERALGKVIVGTIWDNRTGERLLANGAKLTQPLLEKIQLAGIKEIEVAPSQMKLPEALGQILAKEIINEKTGEVILEANQEITSPALDQMFKAGIKSVRTVVIDEVKANLAIRETLKKDSTTSEKEALIEIYRRLRPGEPPLAEGAKRLLERLFFDKGRYDLAKVGRYKINKKLGLNVSMSERILTNEDIIGVIRYLVNLRYGQGFPDDIDHLGNRRIRSVGELLANQVRIGCLRMVRGIREKMSLMDTKSAMPHNLINANPLLVSIREFFGRSQLSQFMDQTNPLAELTHKRRLSALGPGGLSRERAGFEVRDVHHTHYGRLCPVETPEGPNIGLINSLSTYAKVNEFGLIESPYRKVEKGRVTNRIEYLSANEEDEYTIAQANARVNKKGSFLDERVSARRRGDFPKVTPGEIDYMDISPKQLVSISAGLVPFLEHDDANRALMGSNMQRQAVPLLVSESPIVKTGLEAKAAQDSGAGVLARRDGVVEEVDANRIVVRIEESSFNLETHDTYTLDKFLRSNQDTCIHQRPIVEVGQKVKKGQIIADGSAVDRGELALGKNILVAFMPWEGYNFEDAILISESVVKDDKLTSIHIEEYELLARDTKLGKEEITRDIPNVAEEALSNLDEEGIIRLGAVVRPGDILIGKVTPKGETELSSEEKLLRAIFGEKAAEVRDASLRFSPGDEGIVVDIKVFSRKKRPKTKKEKTAFLEELENIKREADKKIKKLSERAKKEIKRLKNKENKERIEEILEAKVGLIRRIRDRDLEMAKKGDELPSGILKMVKVFVAKKRKLSVGDKIAGRHGNKGVIAKILPEEDMPYLADGTPVEILLNPLGVPSRMNVGQILETHLGWAAQALGLKIISPVFDGAREKEITTFLKKAGLPENGKSILYDGRTGEPFDQEITVGYIYMMKLAHLVADKIHARAIGPYSLVTQQPLGGKAQFGGQRFGEMEVWALEAYGAAYTLQEMLTVKSDDITGRTKIYEAIVQEENTFPATLPESFNVLVRELMGLGLDVELERNKTSAATYSAIKVQIASPDVIRSWSHGEVKKPETINYRTFRSERDGLFCEKIFGPTKDYECYCGKYKRMKHEGIVCDRCGVEVSRSSVRRSKMGHIELATPLSHIWYFKGIPSRMGALLGLSQSQLEKVLYFEEYIVTDSGMTKLAKKKILSESEYQDYRKKYGSSFKAAVGGEAIRKLLQEVDLVTLIKEIKNNMRRTTSGQKRLKLAKRLKIVETFRSSGNRPEWMIMEVLPVIPPDLRPLVPLDGGRFATSDLNDLYRRVINRNNRLKRLLDLRAPEVIVRNEKRMLQEAVDALFNNGRRGRLVRGAGGRPLKSLSDMLKGKQGRFRQNLLGKRVDYSGRSVIVIGPELKLHQCGLPKRMALELFEPFIIKRLKDKGYVTSIKEARKLVNQESTEVWNILEEIISQHPVLLNRAPTLHRQGIQAFEPLLVEGDAIKIHPLVCVAFNADFDGDQMAVHVPLSAEAQLEARLLMLSTNNILATSNGTPLVTPTQDIVLGLFYLTKKLPGEKGEGKRFADYEEVLIAYDQGELSLHAQIGVRMDGEIVNTTCGRIILNQVLPKELRFINEEVVKKDISKLVLTCFRKLGRYRTILLLDDLKELGFHFATKAGISIGLDDIEVPKEKKELLDKAKKMVLKVEAEYKKGIITDGERYNKVIDIWTHTTDKVADYMITGLRVPPKGKTKFNSILMMADSGARGSKEQVRQLAGMRGLMAKPSGEIIESPITANFREGLAVLEYFISAHGARKGLADTALKTADSGYLTRRLVDVAQELIITEEDCGTLNGISIGSILEGEEIIVFLQDRIIGRVAQEDITIPHLGEVITKRNEEITEEKAKIIEEAGIDEVKVRSVLTCEAKSGICRKCYGRNLSSGRLVDLGEAVGVIAAQSIGEPGTQLTMRTFHIGGTASRVVVQSRILAKGEGRIEYHSLRTVLNKKTKETVVLNRNGRVSLLDKAGKEIQSQVVPYGALLKEKRGKKVKKGTLLVEWDPYTRPLLAEVEGIVSFSGIVKGVTMRAERDRLTGHTGRVIISHRHTQFHPEILIKDKAGKILDRYTVITGAHIVINPGDRVTPGEVLAKLPREIAKTRDITGGLPRVAELFEARKPKEPAIITEIDGIVKFGDSMRGMRRVIIEGQSETREYFIPQGKHLMVYEGDHVSAGDRLMSGPIIPHDILRVKGDKDLQDYLVNEIQEVYRLQGVVINDKHVEIIVRQMLKKVRIVDPGDTSFLADEAVDRILFREENNKVLKKKKKPATAQPLLLGITRASLTTESFISAASFQETTKVLTEAAASGKKDELMGLKENVIMGHLIPAGTGLSAYQDLELKSSPAISRAEQHKEKMAEVKET
jgi:DNA-directed RNA polymerase subunit beta-beta'